MKKLINVSAHISQVRKNGFMFVSDSYPRPIFIQQFEMEIGKDVISRFCMRKWSDCYVGDPIPVEKLKELKYVICVARDKSPQWYLLEMKEDIEAER